MEHISSVTPTASLCKLVDQQARSHKLKQLTALIEPRREAGMPTNQKAKSQTTTFKAPMRT